MPRAAERARRLRLRVFILGAGKVGAGIARALRTRGHKVELRAARAGLPSRPIDADLLVLAVRDRDLLPLATELAEKGLVRSRTACVHVAGALTAEAISPLRAVSAGVAQMHPMISFASSTRAPRLDAGSMHIAGDAVAVDRARKLARALGMEARTIPELDTVAYHAAAGLVANGAAALAAIGARILEAAGVAPAVAVAMLGPLLHSVADNVATLGFPDALTGPVRRGDPQGVARHLAMFEKRMPEAVPLFLASGIAQLPLARQIGEAEPEGYDAIDLLLRDKWRAISRTL